ncbi:MAG: beta-ketoacyl synthase N-terminal-like domain-containing protein [Polyangiales bacterium]
MRPLAITGLGVVSAFGIGADAFRAALAAPEATRDAAFAAARAVLADARFADAKVAEVQAFEAARYLGDKGLRNLDRITKMLVVAAKHALEDAGLKQGGVFTGVASERAGICAATAYGALDSITEINRVAELEHPRYLNPSRFPNTVINAAAGYVSIWEGLEGPNVTLVDGNCGGADAFATAAMHIAAGRADALLAGGFEVLSEPLYLALEKLGVLADERASRLSLGEGAALLALETCERARARGARVLAEVVGFGAAFEPPRAEAQLVHVSDDAVARAIEAALADAGLAPGDVDLVLSAESGIAGFDRAEQAGIARVLGDDVATIAPKTLWGEAFGASAALSVAAATAWLAGAPLPKLARGQLGSEARTLLITALGYYGNASALIVRSGVRRWEPG